MKDRQGERTEPALHDHVAHLPYGGEAQHRLDIRLRQHDGGCDDRCEAADHEGHV